MTLTSRPEGTVAHPHIHTHTHTHKHTLIITCDKSNRILVRSRCSLSLSHSFSLCPSLSLCFFAAYRRTIYKSSPRRSRALKSRMSAPTRQGDHGISMSELLVRIFDAVSVYSMTYMHRRGVVRQRCPRYVPRSKQICALQSGTQQHVGPAQHPISLEGCTQCFCCCYWGLTHWRCA